MAILQDLTQSELIALVQRMQAANQRKLTCKVTPKGGVSVYGLGRFPVTLYQSQWTRLLSEADTISQFLLDNASALATKD